MLHEMAAASPPPVKLWHFVEYVAGVNHAARQVAVSATVIENLITAATQRHASVGLQTGKLIVVLGL